jgi:hypothetical protein
MGTCLECECAAPSHWLCNRHMNERARARLPPEESTVREAELMRALVFDFPPMICGSDEFAARVRYVSDVWCSTSKVRDIELKHGVTVRVSGAMTRHEMQDLVCAFVEFVCRNTRTAGIAAACADRVLCWYPKLVCTESVASVRRGERMLHALERASGTRDFLVLADLLMAFASVLTRDAIELVYLSYVRRLALFEGMHLMWSA